LTVDRISASKANQPGRATARGRDRAKLDEALQTWASVRNGLGFHRYAELKHRLALAGAGMDRGTLAALATEFGTDLTGLLEIERIAGEPLPALAPLRDA